MLVHLQFKVCSSSKDWQGKGLQPPCSEVTPWPLYQSAIFHAHTHTHTQTSHTQYTVMNTWYTQSMVEGGFFWSTTCASFWRAKLFVAPHSPQMLDYMICGTLTEFCVALEPFPRQPCKAFEAAAILVNGGTKTATKDYIAHGILHILWDKTGVDASAKCGIPLLSGKLSQISRQHKCFWMQCFYKTLSI